MQKPTVSLLITDDASLATACERWSAADLIGVDTEFVRERTYYPRPGLIQVSDREGVTLVDPTGISDFGPLAALLTNASVTKLMHAGDEDLDVVDLLTGVTPVGVFDTQLAGAFAGYGFASSYASLVEVLLGVALDKGLTRSDWLSRPLSWAQLHYASLDVLYLAPMHERLSRELAALGRAAWFEEELQHRRRAWAVSRHPEGAYTRVKRRGKLAPPRHAVLRALSQWREVEAMARDMPRRHLLTDEVLVALASTLDLDAPSLDDVEGLSPRARARYGEALLTCIDVARADGPCGPRLAHQLASLRRHAGSLEGDRQTRSRHAHVTPGARRQPASPRGPGGECRHEQRHSAGVSRLAIRGRHPAPARRHPQTELALMRHFSERAMALWD